MPQFKQHILQNFFGRVRHPLNKRQDFRDVNFLAGLRLAVSIQQFLRFPLLNQDEQRTIFAGVVKLEAGTTGLFAGERHLLDEKIADSFDVRFVFDGEKDVVVDHVYCVEAGKEAGRDAG